MASRVSRGAAGRQGLGRPGAACRASPGQLPRVSLSGDEQGKADNLALGPERLALSEAPSHTGWTRLLFPPSVQFFTNAYGAHATRQATTDQGTSPRPRGPTATAATLRQPNVNRCGKCATAGLTHQVMKSLIFDGFTEAKEVEQGSGNRQRPCPGRWEERKVGGPRADGRGEVSAGDAGSILGQEGSPPNPGEGNGNHSSALAGEIP